jgi:Flp pilus assembly protein TadG
VELALLMPVLSLILLGAIDLGRVFFSYVQLTNGVQAGALYGRSMPNVVSASDAANPYNITFKVQNESDLAIADDDITVRCYEGPAVSSTTLRGDGRCSLASGIRSGDIIEVTATWRFVPITTQLLRLLPPEYAIRKTMRMVIQ